MSAATQRNAMFNGTAQVGNTVEAFKEMGEIIAVNDGKRDPNSQQSNVNASLHRSHYLIRPMLIL
jgi:hypothetical protein